MTERDFSGEASAFKRAYARLCEEADQSLTSESRKAFFSEVYSTSMTLRLVAIDNLMPYLQDKKSLLALADELAISEEQLRLELLLYRSFIDNLLEVIEQV